MTVELKPCAHCGGKAVRDAVWADKYMTASRHTVSCEYCGITTDDYSAPETAEFAWNRREPTQGKQT